MSDDEKRLRDREEHVWDTAFAASIANDDVSPGNLPFARSRAAIVATKAVEMWRKEIVQ